MRRKHVLFRIVEAWVGGVTALLTGWIWMLIAVPLAEFIVFEFILEPFGLSGWYWERRSEGETTE
ncbi:MAG: hypothetical protein U1E51_28705 [Candidatus Binatia bacterium]|nr:hypothetical protein [Candidatus Binatia bacterium]